MSKAYKAAGVDIDAGNETVDRIKKHVNRTRRPEVIGGIGGFGGLFALDPSYRQPVLVSATDGVGTKLKIAFALNRHDTIGIDCVAMCVNDVVVQGAEPLFFLDYLATGKLSPAVAEEIVKGIADGCEQAGCALVGGETAELPGLYNGGEYDIAGFCVGVAERDRLLPSKDIEAGDVLIGLASSGLHSNGFSLARKVLLQDRAFSWDEKVPGSGQTLAEALLIPTKIYVKTLLTLFQKHRVKGAAHITGGGLVENVPRMLPDGLEAQIDRRTWDVPPIFNWIQECGDLAEEDMFRTFNMGIGMVIAVPAEEEEAVLQTAAGCGEKAMVIGKVAQGKNGVTWTEEA
ncbi:MULTISPECIES: phosphoribosylformylglycinamidine cyclo-ligase [Thermoactinomyces]|jgi:phosphoribosylformylglycinamidine cyclo-ligase|uniref:Phosphoribosylformylglycinamidine cyclo-ligase n=1 Tax=Thermoactinomyces daqus TaxID=1329516 RepID=A0A7W1XB52_9BACL|nr:MULTISPECIES: phosphoribosylformylglycinamidine cyclo-ligase [Thermoactinomyces]MBA4543352.1 phosphoribosylformylglycinamidine cyclo-ligase [Thermoactinomyces daqus]MBH8599494.1 phosphoribosylformylglycinamidine cyclo-ligase [Thermoactinomyces sp. CICC 10523]MBH8605282.1 phosphoribosylformylglycinamidine cyclo-ligase [Thermoactinomyces sp. CICC 10522]MBH8608135.1 phosphoribosylformylglycinamidine cyclo-ligase [Thermoactinomyces sp. CICC 10521]